MRTLILFITLALASCVAEGGNEPPVVCTPGESRACACPTGATGAQVCADDGSRLGMCECIVSDGGLEGDGSSQDAGDGSSRDAGDGSSRDAGEVDRDGGVSPDGGTCVYPGGGYGTSVGRNFEPFTLPACDDTPFEFYGAEEGFCDARFTLVTAAAGWCVPCQIEAAETEERINGVYGPQGVRVVIVYIQDEGYNTPDASDCASWKSTYGLSNPVLYDPTQETNAYFPAGALPANLIVDSTGVIVHREYGVSNTLETIRAKLDQLLAEP